MTRHDQDQIARSASAALPQRRFSTVAVRHGAGFGPGPSPAYFDVIEPTESTERPSLVMIHGGAHTGSCFLRTVAGRPGWAHCFASRGFRSFVVDWPGHGRSGAVAPEIMDGEEVCRSLAAFVEWLGEDVVLVTHSMGGAMGWRVAELARSHVTGIVGVAPGPPGNIAATPTILDETRQAVTIESPTGPRTVPTEGLTEMSAGRARYKLIGSSTHFPRACEPAYFASLSSYASRLVYERSNIHGSQVRVADPSRLAGLRVLVVTGTADSDHPRDVDGEIVDWLRSAGVSAQHLFLGDEGIEGNGHMLMLEDNADEVASRIADWIDRSIVR